MMMMMMQMQKGETGGRAAKTNLDPSRHGQRLSR
jgi:hypothetical protein